MINSFISLDQTFSKLQNDLDLEVVPYHSLVEWTRFALQEIGGIGQYFPTTITLPVIDHYAELPGDFFCVDEGKFMKPYKVSLGSLILAQNQGEVTLHYQAWPTDEDGALLIPDDTAYQDAIRWYFMSMMALQGKLTNREFSYEYCNGKWCQKKLEARGNAGMPTIHQLQGQAIDRLNMRHDTNPLAHGFRNQGKTYNRTSRRTAPRGGFRY